MKKKSMEPKKGRVVLADDLPPTLALAEKLSALTTEDYFKSRAANASRAKFERAMSRVPNKTPPDESDRL